MRLTQIEFAEFAGQPASWSLAATQLGQINLIVGKNSAGKTRLVNVINGLAKLITGKQKFESGQYNVTFEDGATTYKYELEIQRGEITSETLLRDSVALLTRALGGVGVIRAEKLDTNIDFQAPANVVAAYVKRDQIQHPFLDVLHNWGQYVRAYAFGTSFGREQILQLTDFSLKPTYHRMAHGPILCPSLTRKLLTSLGQPSTRQSWMT